MQGYIFGGSTGETAESLQRKRLAAQPPMPMPQNVSEGVIAVANALSRRWQEDGRRHFPQAPAGSEGAKFDRPLMGLFRPRGGGLY